MSDRERRLRTLEGTLMGALAWALASGNRRWYRNTLRRLKRVRRALI
jgi:hypothetical protein